jgi:heme/copper-type cytochrome/quinol oxidase subunit 4
MMILLPFSAIFHILTDSVFLERNYWIFFFLSGVSIQVKESFFIHFTEGREHAIEK